MITVIIPAFNAEKTISQTLESILAQTYQKLEIIIIDDGSTDNTFNICQEYKISDKRIKVINQSNSGPSAARNLGIELSSGEYISFVDSDDILPKNGLEYLVSSFKTNNEIDIVIGSYYKNKTLIHIPSKKVNNVEIISDLVLSNYIMGYLCNKLYKSSIIKKNNLRLDESLNYAEDLVFNLEYLLHCFFGMYINENVYYYNYHSNSLSTSFNKNAISTQLLSYRKAIKILKKENFNNEILNRYEEVYYRTLTGMVMHHRQKLPVSELRLARDEIRKSSVLSLSRFTELKIFFSKIIISFCLFKERFYK